MQLILEPTVKIVWEPQYIGCEEFPIPRDGDDTVKIGSHAAKRCYRSKGEDGRSNVDNQTVILESRHGRILEHINFGLDISGITRGLGNELITHKPGITVSQESTRYVSMEDARYVLEPWMADIYKLHPQFCEAASQTLVGTMPSWRDVEWEGLDDRTKRRIGIVGEHIRIARESFRSYDRQVRELLADRMWDRPGQPSTADRKWSRGKARNSLQLGLDTAIVMTANLRAFRHFIEMRSERTAEAEIRRLAACIFGVLSEKAPFYFADYRVSDYIDGIPEYVTDNRKV